MQGGTANLVFVEWEEMIRNIKGLNRFMYVLSTKCPAINLLAKRSLVAYNIVEG